ncbi:MAG: hypothetical protein V1825_04005 [Candidatus Falkowbacteria bacterium]|nr:hypothetical protein [Candidatus Parcubacteria bacterium]
MKRINKIIIFVFVLAIFCPLKSNADDMITVKPYFKYGSIGWQEENHALASGNKVMAGAGISLTDKQYFVKRVSAEIWVMAEPTDEDREMPSDGLRLAIDGGYEFKLNSKWVVYPLAGIGVERWRRNSPDGDGEQDRFWGDLLFAKANLMVGAKYKDAYYVEAGLNHPFWSDTDSGHSPGGKLGLAVNAGILLHKNVDLGLFYNQTAFGADGSQTESRLTLVGILIGYNF